MNGYRTNLITYSRLFEQNPHLLSIMAKAHIPISEAYISNFGGIFSTKSTSKYSTMPNKCASDDVTELTKSQINAFLT